MKETSGGFRIVIIGGGFTGATLATLLMRGPRHQAFSITIVEPRAHLGCGIAYSAAVPEHRVNIDAKKMAALPDDLENYYRWLVETGTLERDPAAVAPGLGTFASRASFGFYTDDLVRKTSTGTPEITFRHAQTEALSIKRNGAGYQVACAGEMLEADCLALAIGHPAPRLPWPLSELPANPRIIRDPWQKDAVATIKPDDEVLIIGTGLTMGDTVASLRKQGHEAPLTALSRHGLLPLPRPHGPIQSLEISLPDKPVSATLHTIRKAVRMAAENGRPWSDVFDAVRLQNGAVWSHWDLAQKRRFQRHLRAFWDVHRFQAAPQIHDLVHAELAAGKTHILTAKLVDAKDGKDKIAVSFRRRGETSVETHAFDAIINCTGATGPAIKEHALLQQLAENGEISADDFGGVAIDFESRAKSRDGQFNPHLRLLGPAVRGTLGEVSGALELALHAQKVAESIQAACLMALRT